MPMAGGQIDRSADLDSEDGLRAAVYRLLSNLLSAAPDRATLDVCARLSGGDGRFGQTIDTLARIAGATAPEAVRREYQDLFVGLGRGELVPYGSYYLTGFLQEKPLARLRDDMAGLGISAHSDVCDPEDHAAALLEMMAGLIEGTFGVPLSIARQRDFFERHIGSWMSVFAKDMQRAQASVFYGAAGGVLEAFLAIEAEAFALEA